MTARSVVDAVGVRWQHAAMSLLTPSLAPLAGGAAAAIEEAGGMWTVPRTADRDAVVAEVRERGLRALHVAGGAPAFLVELPEVEYLTLSSVDLGDLPDVPRLRHLEVVDWRGALRSPLPRLRWAVLEEGPHGGRGVESVLDAPEVRALRIAHGYPGEDAKLLASRDLQSLWLHRLPGLTSLSGIGRHRSTLGFLDLYRLPRLTSLAPLSGLEALESLSLDGVPAGADLTEVARIPRLRALNIIDQSGVQSLAPLAGHPTLEFVAFGRTYDMDLSPLAEVPHLRMVHLGYQGMWKGSPGAVLQRTELGWDHPAVVESLRLYNSQA